MATWAASPVPHTEGPTASPLGTTSSCALGTDPHVPDGLTFPLGLVFLNTLQEKHRTVVRLGAALLSPPRGASSGAVPRQADMSQPWDLGLL